jgi:protoheme IX farnesyltransferase
MLGWVAATGDLVEAGTLFLIQFFWQFPYFDWVVFLYEDYEKAGFYVTNRKKKIKFSLQLFYIQYCYSSLLPSLGYQ